jgi:hypothetical protein
MPDPPPLVVTTRSRLRGVRYFPQMTLASWLIRRQLAATDGVVRWASIVAGPTEFWTITVWRSRDAMHAFMASGAHGDIMWSISKWLASFWLMRWRPGALQVGTWAGLSFAGATPASPALGQRDHADVVFAEIPTLRAALGTTGAARYDDAPEVQGKRRLVSRGRGVVVRIAAPRWRLLSARADLVRLRRKLRDDPHLLGAVIGKGSGTDLYLLAVWTDGGGAQRLLHSPAAEDVEARWGGRYWAAEWLPDNEFGHWDGRRLRRAPTYRPAPTRE